MWIEVREDTYVEALYDGERLEFGIEKGQVLGDVLYIVNCDF